MHESGLYLNDWAGGDIHLLAEQFDVALDRLHGIEILLASYCRDAFCGEAFILFSREGKLYEVNASHDSSDGISGQWEPEETLVKALLYRLEHGRLGTPEGGVNLFSDELRFLLLELQADGYA